MGFEPAHRGYADAWATRTPEDQRRILSIDEGRPPSPLDDSGWQSLTYTSGPPIADVAVDPAGYP
jgi:hypothetical protein